MVIFPAFWSFPEEGAIIGRLLTGYAELEISLMRCIHVVRDDFDTVLKAMFRIRGEQQRLSVGDALGRHHYQALDLGVEFNAAVKPMDYCRQIRNQYAHCN
jgi:hypothetical protein